MLSDFAKAIQGQGGVPRPQWATLGQAEGLIPASLGLQRQAMQNQLGPTIYTSSSRSGIESSHFTGAQAMQLSTTGGVSKG